MEEDGSGMGACGWQEGLAPSISICFLKHM